MGVYLNNLVLLARLKKHEAFVKRAGELSANTATIAPRLRIGMFANLIHYYTLVAPNIENALRYSERGLAIAAGEESVEPEAKLMLLNNIAYALVENGRYHEAGEVLGKLSRWIHHNPYATATLGFFHIARGNLLRGHELYREAVRMLPSKTGRDTFLQKMHLEPGKAYLRAEDKRNAAKYLRRALEPKSGIKSIYSEARQLLNSLDRT